MVTYEEWSRPLSRRPECTAELDKLTSVGYLKLGLLFFMYQQCCSRARTMLFFSFFIGLIKNITTCSNESAFSHCKLLKQTKLGDPVSTFSNLIINPKIITTKRSAVRQRTVGIALKVDVRGLRDRLGGKRRRRQMRKGAPEVPLRRILLAQPAAVSVSHRLFFSPTVLLLFAHFWVAKSPHHPAKIHEKRAHHHNHECVGLYHCFGDGRRHAFWVDLSLGSLFRSDCQCMWDHPWGWITVLPNLPGLSLL